jgi:hypothetical protein
VYFVVHSLSGLKARVITGFYSEIYCTFEAMSVEFSATDAQAYKQSYPALRTSYTGTSQQAVLSLRGALATKQSSLACGAGGLDCFAALATTGGASRRRVGW